jgi:HK97 family phage major capsid protein
MQYAALKRARSALDVAMHSTMPQPEPFSLAAVINHLVDDEQLPDLEAARSRSLAALAHETHGGVHIPLRAFMARDLVTSTSTAGGITVSPAEGRGLLLPEFGVASSVLAAGATVYPNLQGDLLVPSLTNGAGITWLSTETSSPSTAAATFAQTKIQPRLALGYIDVTRRLRKQSSVEIERVVADWLRRACARAIDQAALVGTGTSGQPLGLVGQAGLGSVAMGIDGAALTRDRVLQLVDDVAASRAFRPDSRPAFLLNSATALAAARIEDGTGSGRYLFEPAGDGFTGTLCGWAARISDHLPSNGTKGAGTNLSTLLFGDFRQLLIGLWAGGVELQVNPYQFSTDGAVRIAVYVTMGVAVAKPDAFSLAADVVTS